nr:protein Ycf2-like [Crassostrea gigas]
MESKSDSGNGPVINMERVPITEGQKIHCSDDKSANGIRNGEIQRRIKNIPELEERRLLALERHIKRKRRRRLYVKKMKSSDKTEQQLQKMPDDPGAFDFKNERVQDFEGKEKEDSIQNVVDGNGMAALETYEEKQTDPRTTNELIEDFEVQSTKDVQFNKLVKYLLDGVKSEIIKKVEEGLKSQSEVKQSEVEEEALGQIKKNEGAGMEVKQENEENFTCLKKVNTSLPEEARHRNDEGLKKEKENFQDEGHQLLEKAKDNDNKIVDIREENAVKSFKAPVTGSKEPKPKDPELEAVKSNQLIKREVDEEKTGFDTRNKLVLDDYEDDDDDDDGFMPRKLFFFSFSEFKKEETSA